MTKNHFRSHFSPFQINTQLWFFLIFFTKWLPAAILDDRNSLSIAFLAILDQYATFFFTKWLAAGILDDRKSLSITFLAISDQYATFNFFLIFTKWLSAAILDERKSLSNAFLAISDQYTIFFWNFFFKMADGGHFGSPIWMTENHFRSHFSPFQINTQLFFWIFWKSDLRQKQ